MRARKRILYGGRFYQPGDVLPSGVPANVLDAWQKNGVLAKEEIKETDKDDAKGRAKK